MSNCRQCERLKPIQKAWERFKHLDVLLSDEEWMKEEGHPMTPQRHCLFDLWQAIKKAAKEHNNRGPHNGKGEVTCNNS